MGMSMSNVIWAVAWGIFGIALILKPGYWSGRNQMYVNSENWNVPLGIFALIYSAWIIFSELMRVRRKKVEKIENQS